MRISTRRTCLKIETESYRTGGAVRTTFRAGARDPLRLPTRCRAPLSFVTDNDGYRRMAGFALALLDEGCLSDADSGAVADLVKRGLRRLIASEIGVPRFVEDFELVVSSTLEGVQGYSDPDGAAQSESWWIGIDLVHTANECFIAERTMALEAAVPGLGQTALNLLHQAAAATTGAWTPETTAYHAAQCLWFGVDQQDEWLEEVEAMGASPDDFDLSPETFKAMFDQSWVLSPESKIAGRQLRALRRHPNQEVAQVAMLLEEIVRLRDAHAAFTGVELTDMESVYRGALVRWRDNDPIPQVTDELIHHANQCCDCFTTLASIWEIGQTQQDVAKWIGQFRQGLKLYKALDELLTLLAGPSGENHERDTNQS